MGEAFFLQNALYSNLLTSKDGVENCEIGGEGHGSDDSKTGSNANRPRRRGHLLKIRVQTILVEGNGEFS